MALDSFLLMMGHVLDRGTVRNFLVGRVISTDPLSVQWYAPEEPAVFDGSWVPLFLDAHPHTDEVVAQSVHKAFDPIPCFGSDWMTLPDDVIDFLKSSDLF